MKKANTAPDNFTRRIYTTLLETLELCEVDGRFHVTFFKEKAIQGYGSSERLQERIDLNEAFSVRHNAADRKIEIYSIINIDNGKEGRLQRVEVAELNLLPSNMDNLPFDHERLAAIADRLKTVVTELNDKRGMPKRMLCFVNSMSGERMRAVKRFSRVAAPLLRLAAITFDTVVITDPSNPYRLDSTVLRNRFGLENAKLTFLRPNVYVVQCEEADFDQFDAVLVSGGDGTLSEAMLGVFNRSHHVETLTPNSSIKPISRPIFAMLGAGTTDAVSMTIRGSDDSTTAILNIISGRSIGVDVQALFDCPRQFDPENGLESNLARNSAFKALSVSTVMAAGLLAEVNLYAARLRPVFGALRMAAATVGLILRNRRLKLSVYYKASPVQPKFNRTFCASNCKDCTTSVEKAKLAENSRECNTSLWNGEETWRRAGNSGFLGVSVPTNATISKFRMAGFAPHGHLGDGTSDMVMFAHKPTIFHYIEPQIKLGKVSRDMYDLGDTGTEIVRVHEYSVEPVSDRDLPHLCVCDGEIIYFKERLHVVVLHQLFKMYGTGRIIENGS